MKKNAGILDRIIRIIVGLLIIAGGYYYQSFWALVGIIPLVSGLTGFCPFYGAFGLSTCPASEKNKTFDFK
jgi:hypothetical protein